ncbi:dolichol monophosphate mannose synthase, partial [candidate division WWE3 bacterium CG_4_8_14_3_um_filter_42_11]
MEINAKRAKPKKLVIVIPTLNELDNIQKLYQAVKTQTQKIDGWDTHLLFVDSHSTDGTLEVCRSLVRK